MIENLQVTSFIEKTYEENTGLTIQNYQRDALVGSFVWSIHDARSEKH